MVDFGGSLPPGVKQLLTSFEKASMLLYSLKNYYKFGFKKPFKAVKAGVFGLSTSPKCNHQSTASCSSHSDTFSHDSNGELLAFVWQLAIHHHFETVKRRWMPFFEQIFDLFFSRTMNTHIITVILSQSLSSLLLISSRRCLPATCLTARLFFSPFSFVKHFFLNPSPPLRVTSMWISPWLPGATWMERDKWICQELKAGGTKARKGKPICRAELEDVQTLRRIADTNRLACDENANKKHDVHLA